jgi:Ca-activated chloride channel family protein
MFGSASSNQLDGIAQLTNAKVFDGRTNLLEAFKQVRGYN